MSTASPNKSPVESKPLLPPPENFWKKYSARHEMPLSSFLSVALHALGIGAILVGAILAQLRWEGPEGKPPENEMVYFAGDGQEGGGGGPGGPGGEGAPGAEVTLASADEVYGKLAAEAEPEPMPEEPSVELETTPENDASLTDTDILLKKIGAEPIVEVKKTTTDKPLVKKAVVTTKKKSTTGGVRTGGKGGGAGPGGGYGGGFGGSNLGQGPGTGAGKFGKKATMQEFLAQRWNFNPKGNPQEHLDKLIKAGVQIGLRETTGRFYMVTDLRSRPAQVRLDNYEKYNDIVKWFNNSQQSVMGLMGVLGIRMQVGQAVLFLPKDREKECMEEEIRFAKANNMALRDFDWIEFDFVFRNGKYMPEGLRVGKGRFPG